MDLYFVNFFFLRSSYCWFLTALNMVRFTTFSLSCMFQIFFRSLPHLLLIWNYRFQISFCLILHHQSFLWLFHRWLHAYKNLFQSQVDQYLIVILCFVLGSPRWCVPCLLFTEKGVCGILCLCPLVTQWPWKAISSWDIPFLRWRWYLPLKIVVNIHQIIYLKHMMQSKHSLVDIV